MVTVFEAREVEPNLQLIHTEPGVVKVGIMAEALTILWGKQTFKQSSRRLIIIVK